MVKALLQRRGAIRLRWKLAAKDLETIPSIVQLSQSQGRIGCGYELLEPGASYPTARGRLELARFAGRSRSWNLTAAAYQRSPLWRRSHPQLG